MQLGAARRDWLQQLRLMYSITLMRLQELCKTCASLVGFLLFYFILAQSGKIIAQLLCKSIIYFILFYCKWANRLIDQNCGVKALLLMPRYQLLPWCSLLQTDILVRCSDREVGAYRHHRTVNDD